MGKQRILVVDDDHDILDLLEYNLEREGFKVRTVDNSAEAVDVCMEFVPDLIILDIMMPGLTGLETCKRLKQNPQTQDIPVIFVTALADDRDETEGFAVGCVDYITKPVSAPIVLARVKAQLSLVSAAALRETRLQIIQRLGRAAEYKDNETGLHVVRMSHYAREIAL
ncbi:MAG: response regulator, partial [Cyclobacteriaceae bacterium]|nr:response regulator [Cyclobacteriaceae bacterium]